MAYATPAQLLIHKDARTVGMLASDNNAAVTSDQLLVNPVVLEMLSAASGEMEGAFVVGNRYSTDDIAAIVQAGGYSASKLARMCAEIAFGMLWERRPDLQLNELRQQAYEKQEQALEDLRTGKRLFNLPQVVNASNPSVSGPSSMTVRQLNGMADRFCRGHMAPGLRLPNGR